ncbi:MAG: YkvA family protein [Chthoniobacterales bacterium]
MTIDEYIEDQGQDVNATDLCVLGAFTGRLLEKLTEANPNDYPGLREAVHVIIRVLESAVAQQAKDPLPRWLAETGFAAGYFLKRYDLIPDHLPEIGLADDALILQRVVVRNQLELHRSLAKCIDIAAGNSRDNRNN